MFFRRVVTRSGDKEYVYLKLIENYREGAKVKQRVIANFGNIEHLTPEKVHAIISGRSEVGEAGALLDGFLARDEQDLDLSLAALRRAWNRLGLTGFLHEAAGAGDGELHPAAPFLIEAMVLLHILRPNETRPVYTSYRYLGLPELTSWQPTGADFYRAGTFLAETRAALQNHLFHELCAKRAKPPFLFLLPVQTDFLGHEYEITPAGLSLETKTYRRPLNILLTVFPPDLPVGFQLGNVEQSVTGLADPAGDQEGTRLCLLLEDMDLLARRNLNHEVCYIAALPVDKLARVPVNADDAWETTDTTVDGRYWIKDLVKPDARYIFAYELQEEAAGRDHIAGLLAQAEREFERLKTAVRHRRLIREKTIMARAAEIMDRHGCPDFFRCSFDPVHRTFEYTRLEDIINRHRVLRRTRVLKTSAFGLPARDIVTAHLDGLLLKKALQPVHDLLRIPVMQVQAELHHNERFLTGQLLIYILGEALLRSAAGDRG